MSDGYDIVGKPMPLVSSREKAAGRALYCDDIRVSRPLVVRILRSTHASARIESIETGKARVIPGVAAVITGDDFDRTFGVLPMSRDEPPLAKGRVRYIGEPVAAVAAETNDAAIRALEAIRVEYSQTKSCLDSREALKATSDPIHPELGKGTNVHKSVEQKFGDPAKGFAESAAVVEREFEFSPLNHAFAEPHAAAVEIDASGDLTVHSATQVPHYLHRALSEVLDVPLHRIRVIKPHLGGGFGGKSDPFPHEIIAAKLSLLTGRNTKIALSRDEAFFANHGRHGTRIRMRLGLHPSMGIRAADASILIDGGAYGSFGVVTTYYNGVLLEGPYSIPNYSFHCDRAYTNKPMCGAMRGHGGVNPRFAFESLLDMACRELGLDPCEARLKFIFSENSLTPNEFRITSCGLRAGLAEAMRRSGWREKFGKLPYGKGIGVACGFYISGSALPIHRNGMPQSTVRITIDHDGRVTVYSGSADIGQGSDTVLTQVVAEVLGLDAAMIRVVSGDTALCPTDLGSYSSRVTFMAGNAARNAAISMRRQLAAAACGLLGIEEPTYERPLAPSSPFRQGGRRPDFDDPYLGPNPDYSDGFIFRRGEVWRAKAPGDKLKYIDVVRRALDCHGALQSQGIYISPKMGGTFKGAGAGLSPSYSYTAYITEVTVDPETGFVRVDKVTCAHDCGFPLNPMMVDGQIEGQVHMALGQALMEGLTYEGGAMQNASLLEYKVPSPFEQPEIEIIHAPSDESEGPFGAKEVGEGALAPFIPSVANAIFDAVGARMTRLPMTPDRVLEEMEKQGQRKR